MKKAITIGLLLLIPTLFVHIPKYKELNNLIIVKTIEVKCQGKEYNVKLKEILPEKEDNGIEYKYKNYEEKGTNLKDIKATIENSTKKKFYYKRTDYLITNCTNEKDIMNTFKIKKKDN